MVGYVGDHPLFEFQFIGRAAGHVAPEWPAAPSGLGNHRWVIEIDAVPRIVASVDARIEDEDESQLQGGLRHLPGSAGVGMRAVNAVPAVCRSEPGIRTTLDLAITAGQPPSR
jgi:hypothetical protein